jgi:hypothetical protein
MMKEQLGMRNGECGMGDMSMNSFIEEKIIAAVRGLLTGRVNEILRDGEFPIPLIEFSDYQGDTAVVPVICLSTCERSEKERIILQDAYSLTITFSLPETRESELHCYAYAAAVGIGIREYPTLGGYADRVVVMGKKYVNPKKPYCGGGWEVEISLRITVENEE